MVKYIENTTHYRHPLDIQNRLWYIKGCEDSGNLPRATPAPPSDSLVIPMWCYVKVTDSTAVGRQDPAPALRLMSVLIVHWWCHLAFRGTHFLAITVGWPGIITCCSKPCPRSCWINGATGGHHQGIILASAGLLFARQSNRTPN